MITKDDTTRTDPPDDGDSPDKTGKTEPGKGAERPDQSEAEKAEYHKRQALEHKTKAEQLNALFTKYGVSTVEELNEKLSGSRQPPDDEDEDEDEGGEGDDDIQMERAVDEWANKGDAVARFAKQKIKKLEERIDRLTSGVGNALVVRDIEDKSLRNRVIAHYRKNKGRLRNIQEARIEIEHADLKKERDRLAAELKNLQKEPDPDVRNAPRTLGREISVQEINDVKKMTTSEFDAKIDQLRAAGRHHDAMALQRRYRKDEIELTPG